MKLVLLLLLLGACSTIKTCEEDECFFKERPNMTDRL